MRLALIAIGVLALAGTASATVRKVPADYTTIEAAAGAAGPGDTIQVARGRYTIDVTINFVDADLTITGSGAIIDGARPNLNNQNINPFYVDPAATGCTIQGFTFVNGSYAIYSDAANLLVTKCTFIDTSNYSVYSNVGDGLTVTGCKFLGVYSAIYANTANARISKNTVRATDDEAIDVNKPGARIEANTISYIEDSYGIYVNGNNAIVLKNKLFNVDGDAIYLSSSNDAIVSGNTVKKVDADTGVYVTGDRAKVEKNKVTDTGYGLEVYANSNLTEVTVVGNKVSDVHDGDYGLEVGADKMIVTGNSAIFGSNDAEGFYLYSYTDPAAAGATNGLIDNNKASEFMGDGFDCNSIYNVTMKNCSAVNCGSEDEEGFYMDGNDNVISGLKASGIDNVGIYHGSGNNNTYTKCAVTNVWADGFRVYGNNNEFIDCTAAKCGGEGFDNRGGGGGVTKLTGGKYRGDRNDVADSAGGTNITLTGVDTSTPGTPVSQVD